MALSIMLRDKTAYWTLAALQLRKSKVKREELIGNVKGHLIMERDVSRSKQHVLKGVHQRYGDTAQEFLLSKLSHTYSAWPTLVLSGLACSLVGVIGYCCFNQYGVAAYRSKDYDNFDSANFLELKKIPKHKQIMDFSGKMDDRIPLVDELHRKMIAAAKERGTRR